MQNLDPKVLDEVRRQLKDGRKIEAIKLVCESTGLGLAASKALVEEYSATGSAPSLGDQPDARSANRVPGVGLPLKVQGLLREGRKIKAIKALRETNGIGLKEAKNEVEAFLELHPDGARHPSRGPGVTIAIVIVLALVGWYVSRMLQTGPS